MESTQERTVETSFLRSAIEGAFRQRLLILFTFSLLLLCTLVFSFLPKKQYRSEMKLLIQNARSTNVITADRSAVPSTGDVTEQQINSELEVLQSQDVIGAVADADWDSSQSAQKSAGDIRNHDLKLLALTKRLSFEAGRKSNVIQVVCVDGSAQAAADTLNRLMAAYMTKRKLLSRPGGATAFYAEEARRYENDWNTANNKLIEFQQQNHLVSVPGTEDVIKGQVNELDSQIVSTTTALAESRRKLRELDLAISVVPDRQPTQVRTIANQYSIEQMQTLLVQLDNKRTELLTRYKPTDSLAIELEKQIQNTSQALERARTQKGEESTTDINPAWQQLRTGQSQEQVNLGALQGRLASLRQSKDTLQQQLAGTQDLSATYSSLKLRADEAEADYKTFSEKHDRADIEDAMDEHKLVNVALAEYPTVSYRAFSPRPLQNIALGMMTALFIAAGLTYFTERSRSTIADVHELEAFTPKPVLASVPLFGIEEASSFHKVQAPLGTAI